MLWPWTLAAYERPNVPQACLTLQDDHGLSTAFLLWAVWASEVDPQILSDGSKLAKSWEVEVMVPVRHIRRWLKSTLPGMADSAREALRDRIKLLELDAERLLMESLETLTAVPPEHRATLECLRAAAAAWGTHNVDDALQVLAEGLD